MKRLIALILVSAFGGAFISTTCFQLSTHRTVIAQDAAGTGAATSNTATVTDRELADFTPEERVNIAVYEQTNQSVVNITTTMVRGDAFFFGEVPSEGSGSGSVLDRQGHILTNYHVIEGAREADVRLFNGDSYSAKLVGQDPNNDIAVLKIDAPAKVLFPVMLGDSAGLRVGQ